MSQKVIVTVKEGKIRGFKTKSAFSGTEYYSFLKVPYGQSTAERARFKDPVKAKPWNDVRDATSGTKGCVQFSFTEKSVVGNEDCLYNNIHTTKIPSKGDNQLKTVIVNIHPGAFVNGSPDPDYYGSAEYIMNRDIVYVSIGFRLHILGHLNLNLENSCSGNQSLKDIILSLKWIKDNIHVFGGDSENITLLGSSAGSGIVHSLLLSPLAKGLYHKAVVMGMYVFNPTNVLYEEHIIHAYEIACERGYEGKMEDKRKLLNFLKQMDMDIYLLSKLHKFHDVDTLQIFPCSPFMPTNERSKSSPFPIPPKDLVPSTNRVPIIVGFCDREAIMGVAFLNRMKRSLSENFNKLFTQNAWGWGADLKDNELKLIKKEVEDFYLDGKSMDNASDSTKCDIMTDVSLSDLYDTLINVVSSDPNSPVYVYKFSYQGKLYSIRDQIERDIQSPVDGAFHAADYSYWCFVENRLKKTVHQIVPKDREMIDTMTNFMTTFAKSGNPNNDHLQVNWKPSTLENPCYLSINETLDVKDGLMNGERMQFWHDLKKKFKTRRET